jgi:hypothetical protein
MQAAVRWHANERLEGALRQQDKLQLRISAIADACFSLNADAVSA